MQIYILNVLKGVSEKNLIKGTVSVTSNDLSYKNGNVRFTLVPLNFLLIKNVEDTVVFLCFKMFNSDNFYLFCCSKNTQVGYVENSDLKTSSFQNYKHIAI